MSELLRIAAVIAIVAYVIGSQLRGEALRGKRVVVLPIVLTVIGAVDLHKSGTHLGAADVACLVIGAVIVAGIGLAQGAALRLENRNGGLWGQLPARALWLWVGLVASRLVMTVIAHGVDAKVAAGTTTILLMLGINRLGQAVVVVLRAMSAGIPFAPEKDGSTFLANLTNR
jgi:hypothetical protein